MKLIVGLGNPSKEYENTRHNIGFIYLDHYIEENNLGNCSEKFNGNYWEIRKNNEKIIFLKPLSYMNLSGTVIRKYLDYYKIDLKDLLVIHDDLDMDLGKIKIKASGSSGGHNGIKNIIENVGSQEFLRLKVGISKSNLRDTKDYVLGRFNKQEQEIINSRKKTVSNIINDFINNESNSNIMCKYNGVNNENI